MRDHLEVLMSDEKCFERLIDIVQRHVKLALEFGQRSVSTDRREQIKREIDSLRKEREGLLRLVPIKK